ncbi:MAG: hypothetical protein Q9221_003573 [Calogaya cf. arnoldii]
MSSSVSAAHPISLKDLFRSISTTPTCIGSPSKSCSHILDRSPKDLSIAKDKLYTVLGSTKEGTIPVTKGNISKLKSVAEACTCSTHQPTSANFAYHWLASSRLVRFLNHMGWSTDTAKWNCLALGNLSCTSMLGCLTSTKLHDDIFGLLNRMIRGEKKYQNLRDLTRHWFCGEHQKDDEIFETTVQRLWEEFRQYWIGIGGSPPRKRLGIAKPLADPDTDTSQAGSSINVSPIFDFFDAIDTTANDAMEQTAEPPRISGPNTEDDAEQRQGNSPPRNDPSICEDDLDDASPANSHPSPFFSTQSPGDPRTSLPCFERDFSDTVQPDLVPAMFPDGPSHCSEESDYESPSPASRTGERPAPENLLTPSEITRTPNQLPAFKRRGEVRNDTVFNDVFKRLKEGPGGGNGSPDGYIYVFRSVGSPSHVKVGRTTQTILERANQIARCTGHITPVRNEYNICRVSQYEWLERTILDTLASWQTTFTCALHKGKRCDKLTEHHEWFEVDKDADEIVEHVERCRRWMMSDPYDKHGCLYPRWQRRIEFFETYHKRYQCVLGELSPCKAWSIFFDPPLWLQVHMALYDEFLHQRGDIGCRLTLIRENWHQMVGEAAKTSAILITLFLYARCDWVSNPLILPFIFSCVLCRSIWQK